MPFDSSYFPSKRKATIKKNIGKRKMTPMAPAGKGPQGNYLSDALATARSQFAASPGASRRGASSDQPAALMGAAIAAEKQKLSSQGSGFGSSVRGALSSSSSSGGSFKSSFKHGSPAVAGNRAKSSSRKFTPLAPVRRGGRRYLSRRRATRY